jgi:antitoxin (DNA-binding transcriptional repressor) of toxin-antitoxin stability system
MTEVSVRELRNHLSEYRRRVEYGESVAVRRRGKLVATIRRETKPQSDADAALWKMVREGKAPWSGRKLNPKMPTVSLASANQFRVVSNDEITFSTADHRLSDAAIAEGFAV